MQGLFLSSASRLGLFCDNELLAVYYILYFVCESICLCFECVREKYANNKEGQEDTTSKFRKRFRKNWASWRKRGRMWQVTAATGEWSERSFSGCLPLFIYSESILLSFIEWAARDDGLAQRAGWQMLDSDWQLCHSTDVHADRTLALVWKSSIQSRATEAEITRSVQTAITFHSSSENG